MPSLQDHRLVIEARDPDAKTVRAYCLDLKDDQLTTISVELSWMDQLVAVDQGVSIWQGVGDAGIPDPRGIIVIDIASGTALWSNEEITFVRFEPEAIVAQVRANPGEYLYLDRYSGELQHQLDVAQLPLPRLDQFEQTRHAGIRFPGHHIPGSAQYTVVARQVRRDTGVDITGPISLLNTKHTQVVHTYYEDGGATRSQMLLRGPDPEPMIIDTGTYPSGYTVDPFFLAGEFLIWIRFPDTIGYLFMPT